MEATALDPEVQISSRFDVPMGTTMKVTADETERSGLVGEGTTHGRPRAEEPTRSSTASRTRPS